MISLIDIAPAFSFVLEKGLVQSSATYDPKAFGNFYLVLNGKVFSLRIEQDRGQVFIDIHNDLIGWCKLEYIIEFIDSSLREENLGAPPNPTRLANLLKENWAEIEMVFNDKKRIQALKNFIQKKTDNLLKKIFHNTSADQRF